MCKLFPNPHPVTNEHEILDNINWGTISKAPIDQLLWPTNQKKWFFLYWPFWKSLVNILCKFTSPNSCSPCLRHVLPPNCYVWVIMALLMIMLLGWASVVDLSLCILDCYWSHARWCVLFSNAHLSYIVNNVGSIVQFLHTHRSNDSKWQPWSMF